MLTKTPVVGQILMYRNLRERQSFPVRVIKVSAAVCEVEIIAPIGLQTEVSFARMKTHVALLSER